MLKGGEAEEGEGALVGAQDGGQQAGDEDEEEQVARHQQQKPPTITVAVVADAVAAVECEDDSLGQI